MLNLLNNGLDASAAVAGHTDGPGGFFLATHYLDAEFLTLGGAVKLRYTPDDITPLDTWEYLARSEGQFFRSGAFDPVELAGMIATEALIRGAGNVHIVSEEGWLTVTADHDWLGDQEQDAFRALTPFPESGANGVLAEILATAFSQGVATATAARVTLVRGDSAPAACATGQGIARAVSFRRDRADPIR